MKRSGASRARRHNPPAFYVDECLGRRVAAALADAGHEVHAAVDLHAGEPDHVWLPEIGRRGWILITKDQRIRRNPLEVHAILNAGVRAFVITALDLTPADVIALLMRRMTKIVRICQRKGPFIYNLTAGGSITEIPVARLRRTAGAPRASTDTTR